MKKIPFNKSSIVGSEMHFIKDAVKRGHISGDGYYTKKCLDLFRVKYNYKNALLTTSCTDALEIIAILLDFKNYEEIIIPSFSFVSCANAFEIHGAKIIFCDVDKEFPNLSYKNLSKRITSKTKAILLIHYAGYPCEIKKIKQLCKEKNIILIEDCAHAIDVKYKGKYLGTYGDFSTFSFHETKNISCGEGGMLVINNKKFIRRAEYIFHKGTNRKEFDMNHVNKYEWVDKGSSFLMADLNSAYLYAQLKSINKIQKKRILLFNRYLNNLTSLKNEIKDIFPDFFYTEKLNGHIFYLICKSKNQRLLLLNFLKKYKILATFHYLPLHQSKYYRKMYSRVIYDKEDLVNSIFFSETLLRLPIYYELEEYQVDYICTKIKSFFKRIVA
jgi:dTDP-4-amino-4,6-dideoxygalactose transaminase